MKKHFLPLVAALLLAGGVQATNGNPNEGMVNNPEAMEVAEVGEISVTLGNNNTLYVYHTDRNLCTAKYIGEGTVDYFEWEGDWYVAENMPHSLDYSRVYLTTNNTSAAIANIRVTVHLTNGLKFTQLFGATANTGYN